ncbi:MAG: hypothetical protein KKA36_02570 [Gammaproteobacteria bacterium]|nr:hypothetical protein [Gammaproteobacteria bacterium]MBU2477948.1 hypothetical protein [Gammaproteobacteria bacterium]
MSIHLNKAVLTLLVQLPEHVFTRHLSASPVVVGTALAEQIGQYVQAEHLGYYPALDYFKDHTGAVEQDLLEAADHIAWFSCSQVRGEIERKLRPIFASLKFQSIQSQAFTMPTVRPQQPNAQQELIRHYTPDRVKLVLEASSFQKSAQQDSIAKWASHLAYRWLKESFESIEVTSAQAG